ncbi:MAG: hypothetical protein WAU91_11460 [Desulfatitalea sp.]
MRLGLLLCAWLLLLSGVGHAEPSKELVETFPSGAINWTKGILVAKGSYTPERSATSDGLNPSQSIEQAQHQAALNALRTLKEVRLDACRNVAQLMAVDEQVSARVREMAGTARVVEIHPQSDGSVRVAVQIALLGGFAQLVLPGEIKQVEPIKQVSPSPDGKPPEGELPPLYALSGDVEGYSGLIVDARGMGAKPAMVPLLVDENGKEVYGSAFISREYAVQHGVCEYGRSLEDSARQARVAPKPLAIKGLRTVQERNCNIVISNADAAKLRDASANLGFLKQCRVIIVLD